MREGLVQVEWRSEIQAIARLRTDQRVSYEQNLWGLICEAGFADMQRLPWYPDNRAGSDYVLSSGDSVDVKGTKWSRHYVRLVVPARKTVTASMLVAMQADEINWRWRYIGYIPTVEWEARKRPFNVNKPGWFMYHWELRTEEPSMNGFCSTVGKQLTLKPPSQTVLDFEFATVVIASVYDLNGGIHDRMGV